jgi:hypothetical protein
MKITLGLNDYLLARKTQQVPVFWDLHKVVNAHMLLCGKSGTGKTHTLMRLLNQIKHFGSGVRIHIFDVHGDINAPGMSSVQFSESTRYGINPFKVYPDPHYSGVRKRIQGFIATIKSVKAIGERQEAVLRNILIDLYRLNGFRQEDPRTWPLNDGMARAHPKRYPTLDDLHRFTHSKLQQAFIGSNSATVRALMELNKKKNALFRFLRKNHGCKDPEAEGQLDKLKESAIDAFCNYVSDIETGREFDDLIKYESAETLKSVFDRIENLMAIGIFKSESPPFDPDCAIWRYDITALREEEKKLFVEFRLQEIFFERVQQGHLPTPGLRDVIVIDEAHLFYRDDGDSMVNTMAKEGRKFGLGLICASQSPDHFSDDFVSNVGTKIILGIDQRYWDGAMRKMKIDKNTLEYIRPRKTMAVNFSMVEDLKSQFTLVRVGL